MLSRGVVHGGLFSYLVAGVALCAAEPSLRCCAHGRTRGRSRCSSLAWNGDRRDELDTRALLGYGLWRYRWSCRGDLVAASSGRSPQASRPTRKRCGVLRAGMGFAVRGTAARLGKPPAGAGTSLPPVTRRIRSQAHTPVGSACACAGCCSRWPRLMLAIAGYFHCAVLLARCCMPRSPRCSGAPAAGPRLCRLVRLRPAQGHPRQSAIISPPSSRASICSRC